jgi:hypothetical protein
MGNLIDSPLVNAPYDKYWDGPPTRREMQRAINKLASNDSELMGMADTCALLINFICEVKLKVDREEVEIYVAAKKLQMDEARAKMKADSEKVPEKVPEPIPPATAKLVTE